MPSEYDYFCNKLPQKIYISKVFPQNLPDDPFPTRQKRIVSAVVDREPFDEFVIVKGEIALRRTPKEREEIKLVIYEDTKGIENLIIQRFKVKNGAPMNNSISLGRSECSKLVNMILYIRKGMLQGPEKIQLIDTDLSHTIDELDFLFSLIKGNEDIIETILQKVVTSRDLVSVAYRKQQLQVFEQMLTDRTADERGWQNFFESNHWIFGYGLNFIFTVGLDDKKLEQTVAGFTFNKHGKRTDALLKTSGKISSLCLVEIKTPQANLLKQSEYRAGVYQPSDELVGGVVQIQKTVTEMMKNISTKIQTTDSDGNPKDEVLFSYIPKTFLIIGGLDEFNTKKGVNEDKFSSFQLFRRNLNNPEIITYDELLDRAKFIVDSESMANKEDDDHLGGDDDHYDEIPY
jgi:hypothetical protein